MTVISAVTSMDGELLKVLAVTLLISRRHCCPTHKRNDHRSLAHQITGFSLLREATGLGAPTPDPDANKQK
tara:strand:- start:184 stop:396 length:213 start_codon:yes stop_codon:yes gene_type:complete